ncbi:MAG: hypothetical protein R3F56_09555 [Planctomycetota bacterium]
MVVAAAASATAQQPAPRALTTPDGSRFVLLPVPGAPPVVSWLIVTPAGPAEDPDGLEGLALAVARASMAGTARVGSRNRATEEDLLARIEENERRRTLLRGAGQQVPEALINSLRSDASQADAVADRLAWERALRQVPALPSRLQRTDHTTLLQLSAPVAGLGRVAALLLARREEPILRGIHDELRGARAELLAVATEDPWTPLRDEIRSLAFGAHAAGRPSITEVEGFRPLSRALALEVFERTQRPERSLHVLTGGFDAEMVAAVLVQAFARSALSVDPFVPSPAPPAPRARTSRLTGGAVTGIAVACRVPVDLDPDAVMLAMTWLAGGDESFLSRRLFAHGMRVGQLRGTYPFGGLRDSALALVEVGADERDTRDGQRAERLFVEVDAALAAAAAEPPLPAELATARGLLAAQRAAQRSTPQGLCLYVALRCARFGMTPEQVLRSLETVDDAAVFRALQEMLEPERRVRVTQEKKS